MGKIYVKVVSDSTLTLHECSFNRGGTVRLLGGKKYRTTILYFGDSLLPLSGGGVRGHEFGNSDAYRFLHGHSQIFPSRVCFGEGRGKSERKTAQW